MQCSATCYVVTGEIDYAYKAMHQMLLFMYYFCQGAEYWMVNDKRPEGRDNYGAVQAGRDLCEIAMTYTGLGRQKAICAIGGIYVELCAGSQRPHLFNAMARTKGKGNWQTDMCIGAAMLAAEVEEIPCRKQWIINAQEVLSAQLLCNLNEDGSWPESLCYHHAVLKHICLFAYFWEH